MEFAAVVLAGGLGRRMGRPDKPLLEIGGTPMLGRVLAAVADAEPRVVVGPADLAPALPPGVALTQERPPGGGPVPAAAAGLALVPDGVPFVALLGADLPFLTADAVGGLLRAAQRRPAYDPTRPPWDGAVLVDDADRPQWLCGVWRTEPLRARLQELDGRGQEVARLRELDGRGRELDGRGRKTPGMRDLVDGLRVALVLTEPAGPAPVWFDCDTEDDVRRAEEWVDGSAGTVDG